MYMIISIKTKYLSIASNAESPKFKYFELKQSPKLITQKLKKLNVGMNQTFIYPLLAK